MKRCTVPRNFRSLNQELQKMMSAPAAEICPLNNSVVKRHVSPAVYRIVLAVLVFFVAMHPGAPREVQAAIYKWVDENGKVHYSDKAPADDAPEMDIESAPSTTGPTLTETQRKAKQQRLLDAFEKERNDKEAAEAAAAQQKKELKSWCRQSREQLAQVRSAGYLYDYDEDGNTVVLSHEQRAAATKKYEDRIKKYC
jgi:hypothetical protein